MYYLSIISPSFLTIMLDYSQAAISSQEKLPAYAEKCNKS